MMHHRGNTGEGIIIRCRRTDKWHGGAEGEHFSVLFIYIVYITANGEQGVYREEVAMWKGELKGLQLNEGE